MISKMFATMDTFDFHTGKVLLMFGTENLEILTMLPDLVLHESLTELLVVIILWCGLKSTTAN